MLTKEQGYLILDYHYKLNNLNMNQTKLFTYFEEAIINSNHNLPLTSEEIIHDLVKRFSNELSNGNITKNKINSLVKKYIETKTNELRFEQAIQKELELLKYI